ncbi:IS1182 family transposase [Glycomyces salinus]|uniref:IS1182 family transposase n=1 Tax=Glycomyces salinus TaxID=980294 RepID=UPI00355793CD
MARSAFPKRSLAMRIRETLGPIWSDEEFARAFSSTGRPAVSPVALCLVSVLQHVEGFADRQAAEAVRGRIDWKYALGLELTDPGFDYSVLSEFRARLVEHELGMRVFDAVIECCDAAGLLERDGRVRTDSTVVLAGVRWLNRLEFCGETVRSALEAIAAAEPDWLAERISGQQVERYGKPVDNWRLPKKAVDRNKRLRQFAKDGFWLLDQCAADARGPGAALADLEAVSVLRRVWGQQFERCGGRIVVRTADDLPPSEEVVVSPFDIDARYSVKRGQSWNGYKAHLSEACEPGYPHVIVGVYTTDATVPDLSCTEPITRQLRARGLRPRTHFVDQGYVAAYHLVREAASGTVLHGPIRGDWSTTKGADVLFKPTDFVVDEPTRTVTCPAGQRSTGWSVRIGDNGTPYANVSFPVGVCRPCPLRAKCTRANMDKNQRGRGLKVMLGAYRKAMLERRAEQETEPWRESYKQRSGVEGAISQATGRIGMRRCKYRSLDKTALQHILGATAMNFIRVNAWRCGYRSETTRTTHLARLQLQTQT